MVTRARPTGGPVLLLASLVLACAAGCSRREAEAPPPRPFVELREGPDRWSPPPLIARPAIRPRINDKGLAIIRESEGLRLEAYHLAGQWLIGYGHAASAGEGMTITEEEAERLLLEDIARTEAGLLKLLQVPLNENEFSALVSLAYNLGVGGFERSMLFRRLLEGDRQGAADAFLYLDSAVIDGERVELEALTRRRAAERALFLTPPEAPAQARGSDEGAISRP